MRWIACLLVLAGCSRQARRAAEAPPPHLADAAPVVVPPPADAALDAAGTLPAVDDTCAVDGDCAVDLTTLEGPLTCCARCGRSLPASKKWIERLRQICAGRPSGVCPALDCPVGPMTSHCQAGHCVN